MRVHLKLISDLYSLPDKNGKQKLIKKDILTRLWINIQDIRYVEEIFDVKGKIIKGVCAIKVDQESLRVKHSYEDIVDMVENNHKKRDIEIGFNKKS